MENGTTNTTTNRAAADECDRLRREYEMASEAYNEAVRAAKYGTNSWQRRHRDNRLRPGDDRGELTKAIADYNAKVPDLRRQYDELQAIRKRAADASRACGNGCSLPDCMGRAARLPESGMTNVPIGTSWLPFAAVPTVEVDAGALRATPLCHYHLCKYAKAKGKAAWLKRNRAIVQVAA